MAVVAQDQLNKHFRARKSTVFKKAAELSTLCGVDVLLVCYDPDSPNAPQSWSSKSDPSEIVNEYFRRSKMEKGVNNKLMMSTKKDQLIDIPNMGLDALNDLDCVLSRKIDEINQRMNLIKSAVGSSNNSSSGFNNNYEVPSSSSLTSDCDANNNNKIMIDFDQSYSLDDVEFEEEVNDNTHQVGTSVCNGNNGQTNTDGLSLDDLDFEGCDQMWSGPQYAGGDDQKMMKTCDGFQSSDQVWASPEKYNEETELMIDVSDFGDFRFDYDPDDHSLINKFANAYNCAFNAQIPCY